MEITFNSCANSSLFLVFFGQYLEDWLKRLQFDLAEKKGRLTMSSMGKGKSSKFARPSLEPPLTSLPCPSHHSFSLALAESEQRLSQIQELISSMPKPNHDTLRYLLEHLCRSGQLNIFVCVGGGWAGACS